MVKLRKGISFALALMMALGMTACGNDAGTSAGSAVGSAAAAAVGSRDVTLRFSWWGGDARNKATLEVIKQFEKKYPKIKIEAEYGSSDGYNDKLATQLSAGTAPDIVQVDPSYFPTYYHTNKDYFIDMSKQKIDLSGYDADYLKSNGNYDGKQVGLPTGVSGAAIIQNSDLAAKFGVDLTKNYTWDDMLTMGKKIKSADKSNYLLAANLSYIADDLLRPYLLELTGKPLIVDSEKKLGVTQDDLAKGLNLIKSFYDNNVLPPESHMSSYEADNMPKDPDWIAGKYVAGVCVTSTAKVLAAANSNAKFVSAKLPQLKDGKDEGYCASCPQLMCVTSKSQNTPEAVAFLDYFFNNEEAAKTLGAQRSIPAVKAARQIVQDNKLADDLTVNTVNTCLSYKGTLVIGYSSTSEVKSILSDAISAVSYGKSTPEDAAASTYKLLENYLANQK